MDGAMIYVKILVVVGLIVGVRYAAHAVAAFADAHAHAIAVFVIAPFI